MGIPRFDEGLAHLLMAAADYVVVPSRFEPCGLVAQSAARYGALPIVTAVGGLADFVTPEVGPALLHARMHAGSLPMCAESLVARQCLFGHIEKLSIQWSVGTQPPRARACFSYGMAAVSCHVRICCGCLSSYALALPRYDIVYEHGHLWHEH